VPVRRRRVGNASPMAFFALHPRKGRGEVLIDEAAGEAETRDVTPDTTGQVLLPRFLEAVEGARMPALRPITRKAVVA
jgi:hypothetical protein